MKEDLGFINKVPKEDVYKIYLLTEFGNKSYDSITRKKMLEAIYSQIVFSPEWLEKYLKEDVLEFLIKFSKNNFDLTKISLLEYQYLEELQESYLVYYDKNKRKYIIPSIIKETISNCFISSEHKLLDEFYYFIKGLLLTRGFVFATRAKEIYKKLKPKGMNLDFDETLFSFVRFIKEVDYYLLFKEQIIAFEDFDAPINFAYSQSFEYTWEMYISLGKYALNKEIDIFEKLYQECLKETNEKTIKEEFERIIKFLQSDSKYVKDIIAYTYQNLIKDKVKATNLFEKTIDEFPSWEFKGDHFSMIDIEEERSKYLKLLADYDCPCGSGKKESDCCKNLKELYKNKAILKTEKGKSFYALLHMLMFEANLKYKVVKYKSFYGFVDNLSTEEFEEIKRLIFKDKTIIKEFLNKHKNNLKSFDKELINGFLNSYQEKFIAIKYLNQKLVMFDDGLNKKFIVSGIISPISENVDYEELPKIIETRLIPLSDRIIYDVFMYKTDFTLGANIVKQINKLVKTAKIITSIKDFKTNK